MKKILVRFREDPSLEQIEVLVSAPARSPETDALLARLSGTPPDTVTAADAAGALCRLDPGDLVSLSVSGKETVLITETGRYTARQSLQSLEERLAGSRFVRVSRYELVNLDKVRKYDFTLAGALRLELAGGMETWASRRCIPELRRRLREGGRGPCL